MPPTPAIPPTLARPDATGAGAHPTWRRYFFWLFLIPVALYLAAIPMVMLPSYERWGPSHWGPSLDFAYRTAGANADVVLFGDSSAFLGVDPRLVDRQLGIKSLVLPNTLGSLAVMQDRALEDYLAHNRKPRLIVLYFTAWDLDFAAQPGTRLYEGEEMLFRHGSAAGIAAFARAHPLELLAFPLRNYSLFVQGVLKQFATGRDRERDTADALGHVDDRERFFSLPQNCALPASDAGTRSSGTVGDLAAKYRARGYRVAVYLAPVPACRNATPLAGETFGGLALAPPQLLPPSSFKQDGYFAHVQPESVPAASKLLADTIAPLLK